MGTKHTPGPWVVRGHNSELPQVWDNGFDVCITDRVFNGNAALIAAVPDLLAVAKKLHLSINGLNATMRSTSPAYSRTTLCQELSALIAENAAAIAKATGEA